MTSKITCMLTKVSRLERITVANQVSDIARCICVYID